MTSQHSAHAAHHPAWQSFRARQREQAEDEARRFVQECDAARQRLAGHRILEPKETATRPN